MLNSLLLNERGKERTISEQSYKFINVNIAWPSLCYMESVLSFYRDSQQLPFRFVMH